MYLSKSMDTMVEGPRQEDDGSRVFLILVTAFLFLLLFIPSTLVFKPMGGVGQPALILALAMLLWFVASVMIGMMPLSRTGRSIRVAMLLFSLAAVGSFIAAMTRDITEVEALGAERGLIDLAAWAGLVVVVSQTVASFGQLERIMRLAVVFGSLVALIGILEFYTGFDVTKYIIIPGLSQSIDISALSNRGGFVRPSSTAIQPIEFGIVMAMLLPFAIHHAFYSRALGWFQKWLPVMLICFAIPVSLSRSGIVGLAAGLLFYVPTWTRARKQGLLVVGALGLAATRILAHGLISTLYAYFAGMFGSSTSGDVAVTTRLADYGMSWPYILERPFFGRGFDTFTPTIYFFTDNEYLHAVVEMGFVGLAALLLVFLTGIHCAAAGRRLTEDDKQRDWGQALLSSLVVAAIGSATFDSLSFPMFSGLLFLMLGGAGAYLRLMAQPREMIRG